MKWYEHISRILDSSDSSVYRDANGKTHIRSQSFTPISMRDQKEITDIMVNEEKKVYRRMYKKVRSLQDVKDDSNAMASRIIDAFVPRYGGTSLSGEPGGISNSRWNIGNVEDPAMYNNVLANVYINPQEAYSLYSQKGIIENIIKKKSQSILLNGMSINNPHFSPRQKDTLKEAALKHSLTNVIADAIRDSLCYGGSLLFPHFKNDSPASYVFNVEKLLKYGILKKDSISYFTTLDRYNTVHFPSWNPTMQDFTAPEKFFIPFLGSDVASARSARVITAPQTGYWGVLSTLGWGLSDFTGWIGAYFNYANVMQAIPTMIQQMSMLVRTFQTDGTLVAEGEAMLQMASELDTIKVRQTSPNNPINMDIVGDLKAIERNFKEVTELTRLIRQDLSAKAGVPEELLFSSEQKAFSSGANADSAWQKQLENTRYIHLDVARQMRNLIKIFVIDSLGSDDEVLKLLPYTTVQFDNPKITNAEQKSNVVAKLTKGFFDMVASGVPMDKALEISMQLSDNEFVISNDIMSALKERQKEKDKMEKERHEMEMKNQKASQNPAFGQAGADKSLNKEGNGHSYEDPLEQKEHEVIKSGGRKLQKKAKQENKMV